MADGARVGKKEGADVGEIDGSPVVGIVVGTKVG
jgi:hypothetical protein